MVFLYKDEWHRSTTYHQNKEHQVPAPVWRTHKSYPDKGVHDFTFSMLWFKVFYQYQYWGFCFVFLFLFFSILILNECVKVHACVPRPQREDTHSIIDASLVSRMWSVRIQGIDISMGNWILLPMVSSRKNSRNHSWERSQHCCSVSWRVQATIGYRSWAGRDSIQRKQEVLHTGCDSSMLSSQPCSMDASRKGSLDTSHEGQDEHGYAISIGQDPTPSEQLVSPCHQRS